MATAKTYVQIQKFVVKDAFDPKCKTTLPPVMQKVAEKVIKGSAKLTLDQPKDKGATGYSLDGSLVSLAPDKQGKNLEAKFSMVISTWPGKSIKAMPSSTASTQIGGPDKIAPGDVQELVSDLVEAVTGEAAKYMASH